MKNIVLLIALSFASSAIAVCSSPISRTNFSSLQVLGSARLNTEFNTVYARANELPGDCVTAESITTTQILNGTITNADISAGAAIDMSKTRYAVAVVSDVKTLGAAGGTCTAGGGSLVRDLNTEVDPDNIVTLSASSITLQAGTYLFEGSAPAYYVGSHIATIINSTDSLNVAVGTSETSTAIAGTSQTRSHFYGITTITSAKVFYLVHECGTTRTTNGFGVQSAGLSSGSDVYSVVKITRIK